MDKLEWNISSKIYKSEYAFAAKTCIRRENLMIIFHKV